MRHKGINKMASFVTAVIKNIFTPTPVSVTFPRRFKSEDRASGEQIESYNMLVTYKNGRSKLFSFPVGEDKSKAYTCAMKFYLRQKERINVYYTLHSNENTK